MTALAMSMGTQHGGLVSAGARQARGAVGRPGVLPGGKVAMRAPRHGFQPTRRGALRVAAVAEPIEPAQRDLQVFTQVDLKRMHEPPANGKEPVRLKIDDQWYDCRGWAEAHPGGARWIRWFDGRDATAVFYALHSYGPNGSAEGMERLNKLPRCDPPPSELKGRQGGARLPSAREYSQLKEFSALRMKLENDGWFKRNPLKEAWALVQVVGLYAAGISLAVEHPVLATAMMGLGMQQAGWLAHDYIHGRGAWCEMMRPLGSLLNGHSAEWWSQKHSLHHCFTNEEQFDHDIFMEPFFFMRSPGESGRPDHPLRKYQHIYGYPLISIMYWLWRFHSINTVIKRNDKKEAALLAVHYTWLFALLPFPVALGSITLGGFMVGALVSATHQSEEIMLDGDEPDFVEGQFRSTRDAECVYGPVETWLWGGMDTQLEHHLFPSMPRYNYHKLRPVLKQWAEENGAGYRISPSTTIIKDNFATLKRVANAP